MGTDVFRRGSVDCLTWHLGALAPKGATKGRGGCIWDEVAPVSIKGSSYYLEIFLEISRKLNSLVMHSGDLQACK